MSTQAEAAEGHAPPPDVPETEIVPPRGWQLVDLAELWRFRELIVILAWRDVKVRYKQTVLGAAWAVLQPGLMMIVFTIFFGRLAKVPAGDPALYPLFVYAGLLPWTFFSSALTNAGNSVLGQERLMTKVYFPRLTLPLSAVAAAVVDFLFAFGLLLVLMPCFGVWPTWRFLLVPLIFAILLVFAVGVGTLLAGLHVAYRDFRFVTPFLIQVWMFATPAIYLDTTAVEPGSLTGLLLNLNPLVGLIDAFRAACLGGPPPWGRLGVAAAAAVAMLAVGCLVFRRIEDRFADII
jgi:lipopolysaccharide transport system permease protein